MYRSIYMFSTKNKSERGQAIVLIAMAIVGLVGFTALAIDGGNAFADRRHAQNAADTAVLSAALTKIRGNNWQTAGLTLASANGYDNSDSNQTITIHTCDTAPSCPAPYDGSDASIDPEEYIRIEIVSNVNTFFAPVVGVEQVTNRVEAIARARPSTTVIPFDGAAVVGLDPNGDSFDAWGNSTWYIYGGGVFANNNAKGKGNKNNVQFPDGDCVTSVGTTSGIQCTASENNTSMFYNYPDDIIPLLPPIPPCDGTAYRGGDGLLHEESGFENRGSVVAHIDDQFAAGLYCIQNAGGNIHDTITGTDVTFYIMDTSFTMKFNGGGGMTVQAPTSGPYKGIMMFSGITNTPCSQNIEFRGNGSGDNVGTIFMPSACIDARGNSGVAQNRTQIIGYTVSSNGTGDVVVNYNPDDNYKAPIPPQIELTR